MIYYNYRSYDMLNYLVTSYIVVMFYISLDNIYQYFVLVDAL